MTPRTKKLESANVIQQDTNAIRREELRTRYFYLIAEQAAIEQELKQLGQEPPSSQTGQESGQGEA
jgi:hypothetical protein